MVGPAQAILYVEHCWWLTNPLSLLGYGITLEKITSEEIMSIYTLYLGWWSLKTIKCSSSTVSFGKKYISHWKLLVFSISYLKLMAMVLTPPFVLLSLLWEWLWSTRWVLALEKCSNSCHGKIIKKKKKWWHEMMPAVTMAMGWQC